MLNRFSDFYIIKWYNIKWFWAVAWNDPPFCCAWISVPGGSVWPTSCRPLPEHSAQSLHQRYWKMVTGWKLKAEGYKKEFMLPFLSSGHWLMVHLPLCVCVLYRGRTSGGQDEKARSKVCPSSPRASNWEVGNPTGELRTIVASGSI